MAVISRFSLPRRGQRPLPWRGVITAISMETGGYRKKGLANRLVRDYYSAGGFSFEGEYQKLYWRLPGLEPFLAGGFGNGQHIATYGH